MDSSRDLPKTGYGDFDVGKGNGSDHDVRILLVKEILSLVVSEQGYYELYFDLIGAGTRGVWAFIYSSTGRT